MNIKGAIFDMDGTIMDSMYIWKESAPEYLESIGAVFTDRIKEMMSTLSFAEAVECVRENLLPHMTSEQLYEGIHGMVENEYKNTAPIKDGAADMLRGIKAMGIKTAVATANDVDLVEAALRRCGVLDCIDDIVTCRMAGVGKERPDVYLMAAGHMGLEPSDIMVFEDSLYAVKTAKAAGFRVTGIADRFSGKNRDELKKLCDVFLESWQDWKKIF